MSWPCNMTQLFVIPISAEFTTRQSLIVFNCQNVFKFMVMSSCVCILIIIYIFFWIDFNPTGHVWLFGMHVSGHSKINFKSMGVTETDWYCAIKKWMHSLHGDNKLDWLKVYGWLDAVCFDFIAHAHAHVWILGRQETLIALIIGQQLCLCFYCLPRILACACAIKSKQTATSHLLLLSVTSCCRTESESERSNNMFGF